MFFTVTTKAVRVVNDRPRQYPSGLTINNYLEVDLVDVQGNAYSTVAGLYMASNGQRDAILRQSGSLELQIELGDQSPDAKYELIDARINT